MSHVRINGIQITNYRSFGEKQTVLFPKEDYLKPVAIVGYNNAGKTNLINAILYGITEKYITKDTFTIDDFHNRNYSNIPKITAFLSSSQENKPDGKYADLSGYHNLNINIDGIDIVEAKLNAYKNKEFTEQSWTAFGAAKYFKIFYINFHDIKREISTKKTSWGNLTSFLAKHIKNIVTLDKDMQEKKETFKGTIKDSTNYILKDSMLSDFISKIQDNYSKNLRDNSCNIDFGLPDYEDIFLEMIFKVGLNGDKENLIPIDHFGDGYISMFVMAVIQSIAESNAEDKCLFLFEEPESFLHENHQEYFYKAVLCKLAENGHQVIYTTHSHKMIDIFDTKGLVRLEYNEISKQTEIKYNKCSENFSVENNPKVLNEIIDFNNYIKIIEPNLNKIIFSKKIILVEGPNDLMVYKELIRKKAFEKHHDERYANTYLNFNNIAIIPHHGKATAHILIELCKHIGLDYYVINDFDFPEDFTSELHFVSETDLKASKLYNEEIALKECKNLKGDELSETTKKAMLTTNWKLIDKAGIDKIHFNIPKLEGTIGYQLNDKNSLGIWNTVKRIDNIDEKIFPLSLSKFLELE